MFVENLQGIAFLVAADENEQDSLLLQSQNLLLEELEASPGVVISKLDPVDSVFADNATP